MTRDVRPLRGTVREIRHPRSEGVPDGGTVAVEPRSDLPSAAVMAGDTLEALRERPALAAGLTAAVGFVAVLLLRLFLLGRSFDIFTDEVTYLDVSRNLASGHGVTLHGNPFFLHPPMFFVIEGFIVRLAHPAGLVLDQVQAIRPFNAALAAITAVAIFEIVRRLSGWKAAVPALALFALDPFVVRLNSRNLIETSAFMWVALGYLVLMTAVPMTSGERVRGQAARAAGSGLLFGLALLSKEMTAFLTVVPVGLALILGWALPRRTALGMIAIAALTYSVYPIAVVVSGLGPQFAEQKLSGVLRFLGIVKTTGFVSAGGPSFVAAVTQNLDVFATTYVLIALGIPACAALLLWGDPRRRLLGLLGASAYILLGYSIKFGTLEEQFFYYLVLPALLTVSVAWWLVVEERGMVGLPVGWRGALERTEPSIRARAVLARLAEAVRIVAPVAVSVALAWSALVWFEVHLTPDNGYQRLLAYMHGNVPNGTAVGVTTDPQQFILQGYVIEQVRTTEPLAAGRVRYVAISTKQIQDGYVHDGASIEAWLRAHAQPVFTFDGRSYGTIELYRLTPPLTYSAPPVADTEAGSRGLSGSARS